MVIWYNFLLAFLCMSEFCVADTPADCKYEDINGDWLFLIGNGDGGKDNAINCTTLGPVLSKITISLKYPNISIDQFGNKGYWSLIYNQGFEVIVHGRKYFAFSKWINKTSYCSQTAVGWTHDVLGKEWSCYQGHKLSSLNNNQLRFVPNRFKFISKIKYSKMVHKSEVANSLYKMDPTLINAINSQNSILWKAGLYSEFESLSWADIYRRQGGWKSSLINSPKTSKASPEIIKEADSLPENFDWRNIEGRNYVSPVENQGNCGSCYTFASVGLLEARMLILTNGTKNLKLSTQDIVDCSPYSQGCDGGFSYLVAGKYAEDFGVADETCYPYKGATRKCSLKKSCTKHYATNYQYIGGFYGACNEQLMKIALVKRGPIAVGFEVYGDFMTYKKGIYHHTGLKNKFNPFELTNHAVLIVGYGVDSTTKTKYWIVKNSWGTSWGEGGFFKIRRGNDECGIESMAFESMPIF